MAGQNITAADAIIELVIAELYPSGFNLEQFEAQNIFEMGDTDMAEYQRTADGKLLGGFVYGDFCKFAETEAESGVCNSKEKY